MKFGYVFALMIPMALTGGHAALAKPMPLTLTFEAVVNGKAFDCHQGYNKVGTSVSRIQVYVES